MNCRQISANSLRKEGLAAREVQVFNPAQRLRKGEQLIDRKVIRAVEVAPVEAMLALLVAGRVDEKNQKWRARTGRHIPPGDPSVARNAGQRFHRGAVGDLTGPLLYSLMERRKILQIRP